MIFGERLLFVHVPKTGGSSVTVYLLGVLPKPIYLSQPIRDDRIDEPGVVQIPGLRHEGLAEARELVAGHGFDIRRFPLILATIRNPYDLEVSRYAYLRAGYPWERGPEQDLALAYDFEEFAVRNEQRGGHWAALDPSAGATPGFAAAYGHGSGRPVAGELKDFYLLDGRFPGNLRLLRFERLIEDLRDALRDVGIVAPEEVPRINQSRRGDYRSYYTPQAEEAVYGRYRWVFDEGFYPRLDFAPALPAVPLPTWSE